MSGTRKYCSGLGHMSSLMTWKGKFSNKTTKICFLLRQCRPTTGPSCRWTRWKRCAGGGGVASCPPCSAPGTPWSGPCSPSTWLPSRLTWVLLEKKSIFNLNIWKFWNITKSGYLMCPGGTLWLERRYRKRGSRQRKTWCGSRIWCHRILPPMYIHT